MKKYTALFLLLVSGSAIFAGGNFRNRMRLKEQFKKIKALESELKVLEAKVNDFAARTQYLEALLGVQSPEPQKKADSNQLENLVATCECHRSSVDHEANVAVQTHDDQEQDDSNGKVSGYYGA
jgi:hypothetical protein